MNMDDEVKAIRHTEPRVPNSMTGFRQHAEHDNAFKDDEATHNRPSYFSMSNRSYAGNVRHTREGSDWRNGRNAQREKASRWQVSQDFMRADLRRRLMMEQGGTVRHTHQVGDPEERLNTRRSHTVTIEPKPSKPSRSRAKRHARKARAWMRKK